MPLVSTIYSTTEGFDLFALLSFNPKSVSQQILIGFVDQLEINEPEDPQAKDEQELGNGRSSILVGMFCLNSILPLARSRPSDCGDGAKRCELERQRGGWGRGVSGRFYTSLLSRVVNSSTYLT